MKLQRQLSRRVGGKEYPKWVVTIPPSQIAELGWHEGEELEAEVRGEALLLVPSNSRSTTAVHQERV